MLSELIRQCAQGNGLTLLRFFCTFADMDDQLYYTMFEDRLVKEMLKICTNAGMLEGILLRSDDIDLKWKEYAPEYIADGVKEIATYPTVSIAWAGYIGLAVACWWNRDWNKLNQNSILSPWDLL